MEDFPVDIDDVNRGESWTTNVLVLDAIFGALGVPDLKVIRLVSKQWAIIGAKALVRKSVICLTGNGPEERSRLYRPRHELMESRFHEGKYWAEIASDSDSSLLFYDDDEMWNIRNYSSFESYLIYLTKLVVFESGFRPRNVSMMYSWDLWRLPIDYSYIEELQIVKMARVDLFHFIDEPIHRFPNLKSLDVICFNPFYGYKNDPNSFSYREQSVVPKEIRLKKLKVRYPIALNDYHGIDWSFILRNFCNLKKVDLNFDLRNQEVWGFMASLGGHTHLGLRKSDYGRFFSKEDMANLTERSYAKLLVGKQGFLPALMHAKDLCLNLTCTTENMAHIISKALNKLSPDTLALKIFGEHEAIEQLIQLVGDRCLDSLAILNVKFEWSGNPQFEEEVVKIAAVLGAKGFFKKSCWSFLFHKYNSKEGGWKLLTKNQAGYTIQIHDSPHYKLRKDPCELVETLLSLYPEMAAGYNYAFFHSVSDTGTGTNICEAVGQEMVSNPRKWLTSLAAATSENRGSSSLLCDQPEFFQQTGVNLGWSKRFVQPNVSTFAFCAVDQDLLDQLTT